MAIYFLVGLGLYAWFLLGANLQDEKLTVTQAVAWLVMHLLAWPALLIVVAWSLLLDD